MARGTGPHNHINWTKKRKINQNTMTEQATLHRVMYRSIGNKLTQSVLRIVYGVDGETYTHDLLNNGWNVKTPSLQFMAYIDKRPSDFGESCSIEIEKDISIPVVEFVDGFLLHNDVLEEGGNKLMNKTWFTGEGDIAGKPESPHTVGNPDPGTGNRGGIEITSEGQ